MFSRVLGQHMYSPHVAFNAPPLLGNLVGWYKADAGVTEVDGKVSVWADQSGNGNDLSQTTADQRFTLITDNGGRKHMLCTRSAQTNMTVPSNMPWNSRSCSVFIVCSQSTRFTALNTFTHFGGIGTDGERAAVQNRNGVFAGFGGVAALTSFRYSNTHSLVGLTSSASATTVYNNDRSEVVTQFTAASGTGGSKFGNATNPATIGLDGTIQEILVYDTALSESQVNNLKSYLNNRWKTNTQGDNYVFFDGDSYTQAVEAHITNDSYQMQLGYLRNWDFVAWTVTTGAGQTAAARTTAAPTLLDPAMAPAKNNVVVAYIGSNDIATAARTPAETLSDLEIYCDARRTAGADKVVVGTVFARHDLDTPTQDAYNTLLKNADFYDGIADFAADSRLQDKDDLTYYNADRIHLNKAGNAVMASVMNPVLAAQLV